jgi:hypothetical protein
MDAAGQWKAHDAGVVNDDDDNGDGAQQIEAWLARTILEARID